VTNVEHFQHDYYGSTDRHSAVAIVSFNNTDDILIVRDGRGGTIRLEEGYVKQLEKAIAKVMNR